MPNGKPGDHPYTDIVVHEYDNYSKRAASLVREIDRLGDQRTRRELADLLFREYNEFDNPNVKKLESVLTEWRNRLLREARDRGLEVED